jgi:hypothetical protein
MITPHHSFYEAMVELASPIIMRIEHKSSEWREVEFMDANGCSVLAEYRNRILIGWTFNYRRPKEGVMTRECV